MNEKDICALSVTGGHIQSKFGPPWGEVSEAYANGNHQHHAHDQPKSTIPSPDNRLNLLNSLGEQRQMLADW